jgi:hypothetical protein
MVQEAKSAVKNLVMNIKVFVSFYILWIGLIIAASIGRNT